MLFFAGSLLSLSLLGRIHLLEEIFNLHWQFAIWNLAWQSKERLLHIQSAICDVQLVLKRIVELTKSFLTDKLLLFVHVIDKFVELAAIETSTKRLGKDVVGQDLVIRTEETRCSFSQAVALRYLLFNGVDPVLQDTDLFVILFHSILFCLLDARRKSLGSALKVFTLSSQLAFGDK